MANRSRRRRKTRTSNRRTRRSNPLFARKTRVKRYRHSSRRSNPGIAGFNTTELVKLAAGGAAGVVGSKMLAQAVLGASNTGYMGALAQAASSVAMAYAANKVGLGKDVSTGILVGGLSGAALALVNLYMGTPGSPVSGLGDPLGAALLGDFVPSTMSIPGLFNTPAPIVVAKKTNGR